MLADTPDMKEQLLAKIENRSAVIGVVGLGYVGLPLAMEFLRVGFRVIGYDVSQRVVARAHGKGFHGDNNDGGWKTERDSLHAAGLERGILEVESTTANAVDASRSPGFC